MKVRSRNLHGYSLFSDPVQILTAQKPAQVALPETSFDQVNDLVYVRWAAPEDMGSAITGYQVWIQEQDGTFSQDLVDCDGSNSVIMAQTECAIPVQKMKDAPFSHPWGASIQSYIVAFNAYGMSAPSERGNGAVIMTVPDAPLYLIEDLQLRSATQIGVEWQTPLNVGGSDVIDYRVFSDQASDSWVVK